MGCWAAALITASGLPATATRSVRPSVERLHLLHAGQRGEGLGGHAIGEGNGDFVALDILEFGHAADAHEAPFADDAHAAAGLLDLAQDVRGEKDGLAGVRASSTMRLNSCWLMRVQAVGRLVQNQQARAVHERLDQDDLALVAAGILAEAAAGVQIEAAGSGLSDRL